MTVYDRALEALQKFWVLPESEQSGFYDDAVDPLIEDAARETRDQPTQDNIGAWLRIQAAAFGLAVEGVSELTADLKETYPAEFDQAVGALPFEQRFSIDLLIKELKGEEFLSDELLQRETDLTAERLNEFRTRLDSTPRSASRILGEFTATSTFKSARGFPVYAGTLNLTGWGGQHLGSYKVNSGGGARTYRLTNGPTPPGLYRVSNHRPNRRTAGMVLHRVGYSFDLNPTSGTQVFGRSLFRIHPDGGSPQTNGCLGVGENRSKLEECEAQISALLDERRAFNLLVTYEGLPVG